MPTPSVEIVRVAGNMPPQWLADAEAIFFQASGRAFAPGRERDAFRERWLGRYLDTPGDVVLLAVAGDAIAGYLAGALHNPAEQDRFSDLGYFRSHFVEACRRFPAHLHINLAPAFRSLGIGRRLIEAFAVLAEEAGAPGVHVVTGKGMRNVRFYERCGFEEIASAPWHGREVVFLGRALGSGAGH